MIDILTRMASQPKPLLENGKKYGFTFLTKFGSYFFLKKEHIEKAQALIKEHPAKAIILGRFNPLTRPLAPFIVGASGLHYTKFWFLDAVAVTAWSAVSIAIGYIFGASYHAVSAILGKYIVIAILIGALIVWGYRFINKQFHVFAKGYKKLLLPQVTCKCSPNRQKQFSQEPLIYSKQYLTPTF